MFGEIFDALVRLLAPVLAYTAEEAWEHAGREGSVHEQLFPEVNAKYATSEAIEKVEKLMEVKSVIQAAIEEKVQAKVFKKNNEAKVLLTVPGNFSVKDLLEDEEFAKEFFIVSQLKVVEGEELGVEVSQTEYEMCPRCRRYEPLLESGLCARCEEAMKS